MRHHLDPYKRRGLAMSAKRSRDELRLRAALERALLAEPGFVPQASRFHRQLRLPGHEATTRWWVRLWWAEVEGRRSASTPPSHGGQEPAQERAPANDTLDIAHIVPLLQFHARAVTELAGLLSAVETRPGGQPPSVEYEGGEPDPSLLVW